MSKKFDEHIKRTLEESSEYREKDKEQIWNAIENDLFKNEKENHGGFIMKNFKKKASLGLTAAAAMIIAFTVQTETGSALVDKVKTMFVPEKEITQSLEGNEEKANFTLHEGKEAEYVIYVDEERYMMKKTEAGDVITTKEPLGDRYPEVSMTITQQKDKSPQELYEELKEAIVSEYSQVFVDGAVQEPVDGYMLLAHKPGHEWDTEVTKLLVFDNGAEGSFVIEQKYFAEASEGHGVRFDEMVKEFHIVPEKK
jgi:hypothetical protein